VSFRVKAKYFKLHVVALRERPDARVWASPDAAAVGGATPKVRCATATHPGRDFPALPRN